MPATKFAAIFVDRDGVINRAGHKEYVWTPDQFEFLPGAVEGLSALRRLCDKMIIVTNQSGIGQGFYTEEQYRSLRNWYHAELAKRGIVIDGEFFCPHHPTAGIGPYRVECECRKPKIGMLLKAREAYRLDLERCCVVGDAGRDMEMAKRAGCLAVHIGTGPAPEKPDAADLHFASLPEAAARLEILQLA